MFGLNCLVVGCGNLGWSERFGGCVVGGWLSLIGVRFGLGGVFGIVFVLCCVCWGLLLLECWCCIVSCVISVWLLWVGVLVGFMSVLGVVVCIFVWFGCW